MHKINLRILPALLATIFVNGALVQAPIASNLPEDLYAIRFKVNLELDKFKGQTFLSFMERKVKPALDSVAREGYEMRDGEAIRKAFELVDRKIKRRIKKNWNGLENVVRIADALNSKMTNLHQLPKEIYQVDPQVDRYNLSTFLGFASGGGVAIKFYDNNYGLNVHYDETENRSGRSFGVGPTRLANDASDKQYLDDLEAYVQEAPENVKEFYSTLLQILLDSDPSNYENISDFGQTLLSDFLSVYTAEQARNLMDKRISPHWDAALLEVTLLGAFHGGQENITLYYQNLNNGTTTFTSQTLVQTPCQNPTIAQKARLRDYWQFSRNINSKKLCRRSGINVTREEFRNLGRKLTELATTRSDT